MNEELKKPIAKIFNDYRVFAPNISDESLRVSLVTRPSEVKWTNEIPLNSWKEVFLPHFEKLFHFQAKNIIAAAKTDSPPTACLGVNVLDLKALTLFEQIFSEDIYYQERRRNILLVGYSESWPIDYKKLKIFSYQFRENVLEHLVFDIFLAQTKQGRTRIFSGSTAGQKILEKYGVKNYRHVEFNGAIDETGPDRKMLTLKARMEKSFQRRIWRELGEICLACGQCSIVCPTCFCFDFEDKSDPIAAGRVRKWGNCFYNDFSKMAGGHKPLTSVREKIYFWYTHKFVRIPKEYGLPGCVSCGRCDRACPVGIKINAVLKKL